MTAITAPIVSPNPDHWLCYIFCKVRPGQEASLQSAAKEFIRSYREKLPTREMVCGRLTHADGSGREEEAEDAYRFLLRFRYESLEVVAGTVINGRSHYREQLTHTLTLLEYPRFDDSKDRRQLTRSENPAAAEQFGIFLIRSPSQSSVGKKQLKDASSLPGLTCVEVLGPYDFIVEFPAKTQGEVDTMHQSIIRVFEADSPKIVALHCSVFSAS